MKIYVDSENRIKDVGSTTDTSLTELEINDDTSPFQGWCIAKICCYKVTVQDGEVIMMTPYVASSTLDFINEIGTANDILLGNMEVPE